MSLWPWLWLLATSVFSTHADVDDPLDDPRSSSVRSGGPTPTGGTQAQPRGDGATQGAAASTSCGSDGAARPSARAIAAEVRASGYAVVRGVIPVALVDAMAAEVDELLAIRMGRAGPDRGDDVMRELNR